MWTALIEKQWITFEKLCICIAIIWTRILGVMVKIAWSTINWFFSSPRKDFQCTVNHIKMLPFIWTVSTMGSNFVIESYTFCKENIERLYQYCYLWCETSLLLAFSILSLKNNSGILTTFLAQHPTQASSECDNVPVMLHVYIQVHVL